MSCFSETSLLQKAAQKKLLAIKLIDFREYGIGERKTVDDRPYGGGAGMLLRPEPVVAAIESLSPNERGPVIMLDARGPVFDGKKAKSLAKTSLLFASLWAV